MGKVAQDDYPTPQPLADAIVKFLFEAFPWKKVFVDAGCGSGNFMRAALRYWTSEAGCAHLGVDIVPKYRPAIETLGHPFFEGDFVKAAPDLGRAGWFGPTSLVYGNPPYGQDLPQRMIEAVSENSLPGCHIAFLLRQSFLGGINRALHFKYRDSLRIKRDIAGRPKFNPNDKSQDHSEYAVFIYEVGYSGPYLGWKEPLIWKPSHLKRLGLSP
jgi:hypothetical protein